MIDNIITYGKKALDRYDYETALNIFSEAVSMNQNDGKGFFWRGIVQLETQNFREAIRDMKISLSLKYPDEILPNYYLGNCYFSVQTYDLAIKHYQDAITKDLDFFEGWNNLGRAHLEEGEWDEAYGCFVQASSILGDNPTLFYNLGMVHNKRGEYIPAILSYNMAIENGHDISEVAMRMESLFDKIHREKEAAYCRLAIEDLVDQNTFVQYIKDIVKDRIKPGEINFE